MILKQGCTGSIVEMLQLALERYGVFGSNKDGIFGTKTHNATIEFQYSNGLVADGIVGDKTFSALKPYLLGYVKHGISYGDTFHKLSRTYDTTVKAIATANPNSDPMALDAGDILTIPLGFTETPTDISWSFALNEFVTQGLAARYPFIKFFSIGKSVLGKPLYCLKIGTGPVNVLYTAATHANEWINTPLLLKFIEEYAKAYSLGGRIYGVSAASLFSKATLYIIPMLNPDGVDLITGALKSGDDFEKARRIAAKYPSIPFPHGWKANILGTDLNLQFPAGWEKAKRIKYSKGFTCPAPKDYVGGSPLDAPESKALYDFTLNISPALILAYHSQGNIIYWKYDRFEPQRSFEIGQLMSSASRYSLDITPDESGSAGFKDWFIQEYDRPGYTVETGCGTNPLPISQFDKIYADNIGILVTGLSQAFY